MPRKTYEGPGDKEYLIPFKEGKGIKEFFKVFRLSSEYKQILRARQYALSIIKDLEGSEKHVQNYASKKEIETIQNYAFILRLFFSGADKDTLVNTLGAKFDIPKDKRLENLEGLLEEFGISFSAIFKEFENE